jgi:protein-L-isoaspartate(D-aspartate) O-methyltransferase
MAALSLADRRRCFAEELEAVAHLDAPALVDAFARVRASGSSAPGRGRSRASSSRRTARRRTPTRATSITTSWSRSIRRASSTTAQPSSLARWLAALELAPGHRVLHIGAGTGYYTAILAEVVGHTGRVVAYEADPALAARAAANLAAWPHATVEAGDAGAPDGRFDAIFVNAGCTYAHPAWLAATDRIMLPLTIHMPSYPLGVGAMLWLDHGTGRDTGRNDGRDGSRWAARMVSQVGIYDYVNARDPAHEPILRRLLAPGVTITAIDPMPHEAGPGCLAHIDGFCVQ